MHEQLLFSDLPAMEQPRARPPTRRSQARVVRAERRQVEMVPTTLDERLARSGRMLHLDRGGRG